MTTCRHSSSVYARLAAGDELPRDLARHAATCPPCIDARARATRFEHELQAGATSLATSVMPDLRATGTRSKRRSSVNRLGLGIAVVAVAVVVGAMLSELDALRPVGGTGNSPGTSARADPTASPSASPSVSPSPSPSVIRPTGAGELVLRLEIAGGLTGPESVRRGLPSVSIYGDGTVITVGSTAETYPEPALPNLQRGQLSGAQIDELIGAAAEAGLTQGNRDLPKSGVVDVPTDYLTVVTDHTSQTSAHALGWEPESDSPERKQMREFIERHLEPLVLTGGEPFEFEQLRIFSRPTVVSSLEPENVFIVDWPLDTDLADFGEPSAFGLPVEGALRCAVISGDEMAAVLDTLDGGHAYTMWRSGKDLVYFFDLRPLLPDESGCPTGDIQTRP